jgi:DNA polymerase-3 subunit delta'
VDRPCRACQACRKVDHGNHPDVHVVAPEGAGEQVRLAQVGALVAELALLPMEGRVRVAIVTAAHRMNPDAQNALLKTLEEPPGRACIVLCADDLAPILPTVVSRAARLRLGPVPSAVIEVLLRDRGLADAARARSAAVASGGLPGVAIALAADPESTIVAARLVRQLLDLVDADRRARLAAVASLLADGAALDAIVRGGPVDETSETGEPVARPSRKPQPAERRRAALRVVAAWRELGRDLAVVARGGRAEVRHLDLLEELGAVAPRLAVGDLVAFLDRLDGLGAAIEAYANPELALDHLVLAWPRASRGAAA